MGIDYLKKYLNTLSFNYIYSIFFPIVFPSVFYRNPFSHLSWPFPGHINRQGNQLRVNLKEIKQDRKIYIQSFYYYGDCFQLKNDWYLYSAPIIQFLYYLNAQLLSTLSCLPNHCQSCYIPRTELLTTIRAIFITNLSTKQGNRIAKEGEYPVKKSNRAKESLRIRQKMISEKTISLKQSQLRMKRSKPEKTFFCDYEDCNRSYSSTLALNLHIKTKHNGGTKKERDAYAKLIILAQLRGEPKPQINFTFSQNYLKKFKQRLLLQHQIHKNQNHQIPKSIN